ncbi:MAG TPA: deoxynucleoside kinase [Aggregatilineaceae bacterium]|nr:deoxynucleoside kinase [Aggregatilineaceae bacterium]
MIQPPNPNKYFVAIAGNIGVGKSTLTGILANAFGWNPFYEAVDENPYLADFYADMRRWSFHSQVFFLSRRLQHHRQLVDDPGSVVQDRSVYEDAEIFAQNLFEQGQMNPRDYQAYRDLYDGIRSFLPPPDLLVYLKSDVNTLLARIKLRGRDFERDISPDYLHRLNILYDRWIERWDYCPVLIIPAHEMDFQRDLEARQLIINGVRENLKPVSIRYLKRPAKTT